MLYKDKKDAFDQALKHIGALEYLNKVHVEDKKLQGRIYQRLMLLESALHEINDPQKIVYCETCKKAFGSRSDSMDYEFMTEGKSPECIGCDHVRGDLIDDMKGGVESE